MQSPFTGGPTRIVRETRPITIKGITYRVEAEHFQCVDTGQQFTIGEQDQEWLNNLNLLRGRHLPLHTHLYDA